MIMILSVFLIWFFETESIVDDNDFECFLDLVFETESIADDNDFEECVFS